MENNAGFRRALSFQLGYRGFQLLLGSDRALQRIAHEFLGNTTDLDVLDIGAGDSEILRFIDPRSYTAIEPNRSYSDAASKRFGDRIISINHGIGDPQLDDIRLDVDLVTIIGVLHHLNDDLVSDCLRLAHKALRARKGTLVVIEPVLVKDQNPLARFLILKDRGQNVRSADRYAHLIKDVFPVVNSDIYHDLLRIPYSHFVAHAQIG